MKNILEPKNWSDVYDALFEHTFNDRIGRYKSRFAFRGVSNEKYDLETSLTRLKGEYPNVEDHLLRQFKKYAYKNMKADNDWYWLSVGQHYGLPTRLLDWSYSPNVALHFATENINNYDKNGAVWKVNYKKVHERLPPELFGIAKGKNTWILTVEILESMFENLDKLDAKGHKIGDFVIFFEPPNLDDRIHNQFAYFSVGSSPTMILNKWLEDKPELWQKVIIPAELKWEIRDKLDQGNISERVLFPGLGGLSQWLKRYYTPTLEKKKS